MAPSLQEMMNEENDEGMIGSINFVKFGIIKK